MAEGQSIERLHVSVVGVFRIVGSDGEDLTPSGSRAKCLFALLALPPGRKRARSWLQDKLWSDRQQKQGSDSLRQELSNLRRDLGPYKDCLLAEPGIVALDAERIQVDRYQEPLSKLAAEHGPERPELLEDLHIQDPEFQDWLRQQRTHFEAELDSLAEAPIATHPPTELQRTPTLLATPISSKAARPWICIRPSEVTGSGKPSFYARIISEAIALGVKEQGVARVVGAPAEPPGLELQVETTQLEDSHVVHVSLWNPAENALVWSGTQEVPRRREFILNIATLQRLINQTVDIAIFEIKLLLSDHDAAKATILGIEAVQLMFQGERDGLGKADKLLDSAFDRSPRGIALAWKAYLRTFLAGEHRTDRAAQSDEVRSMIRDALQAEPHNSTILALASHVHSFVLGEYEAAHELAEASLKYNPSNPLGLVYLGRAKSYLGDFENGYILANRAREVAGPGPYRYTIDFMCGVTAALAGRHDEALRLQELARRLHPGYRAPLRYLVALYLKLGQRDMALGVLQELKLMEPDFSLRLMREQSYPSAGLRSSGLLDSVDEDFN
ncbi:hypothetical protein [Nisaea denitrificans]|uniref:hypothetical protein n=1 Tax=Nisaea denitrificans TaxID=390877 RepID=UPI0012EB0978|nr:hypothetical protein [Nisaea denitrificans]